MLTATSPPVRSARPSGRTDRTYSTALTVRRPISQRGIPGTATLFPELSYQAVWQQLTSALGPLKPSPVSETALRHLRRRLTPAPFKTRLETLAARRRRRDAVTEIAAGSGLYVPRLFDNYTSFSGHPAALFAQPVVRRPASGW